MEKNISRRSLVKGGIMAGALLPAFSLIGSLADAAALTPLDPADPTAKALGFVSDATTVSAAANPTYKAGQRCGTCAQFQGKAGDKTGGCNIFVGHLVPVGGWCKVYAAKPA